MASKSGSKKTSAQKRVAAAGKKVSKAVKKSVTGLKKSMKGPATGIERARKSLMDFTDKLSKQQPVEVLKHLGEQLQEQVDKVRDALPAKKGKRQAVKKKVAASISGLRKKVSKKKRA